MILCTVRLSAARNQWNSLSKSNFSCQNCMLTSPDSTSNTSKTKRNWLQKWHFAWCVYLLLIREATSCKPQTVGIPSLNGVSDAKFPFWLRMKPGAPNSLFLFMQMQPGAPKPSFLLMQMNLLTIKFVQSIILAYASEQLGLQIFQNYHICYANETRGSTTITCACAN